MLPAYPSARLAGTGRRLLLVASLASASSCSASAFSCFASIFVAAFIAVSILAVHVGDADDDQPGLALVELLAELLQVLAAHARRRVTGNRAEQRAAAGGRGEQPAADRGRGEQRDDETGREPDAAAEHATDARRRLVLLHDLDLAVVAPFDDAASYASMRPASLCRSLTAS